ncbi:MmyB family transcriptional regulator [Streptomyces avermitilis]|uniref:MmyB family transcriptional regulator n=1 Tax=Streptomyces avermitilis TaxID=33903 RepID=UPI003801493C
MHLYAGRHPDDPQLTELIGELSLKSDAFRGLWADHDLQAHTTGTKDRRRPHPRLPGPHRPGRPRADPRPLHPEPGSPSAEALGLLASWTSTSTAEALPPERTPGPPG